ncbi:MAG: hypothetical protein ACYSQZ_05720 [Planctomycetota bacterium]
MTKEKSLKQSNNGINFWVGAGLLAVLLSVPVRFTACTVGARPVGPG